MGLIWATWSQASAQMVPNSFASQFGISLVLWGSKQKTKETSNKYADKTL